MNREEAAAEYVTRRAAAAYAIRDTLVTRNAWDMADSALAAADSFDAANGVHRMVMDETAEIRFCPECFGRMYVFIGDPVKWVHAANDTIKCDAE